MNEINELRKIDTENKKENLLIRDERDKAIEKNILYKSEIDNSTVRCTSVTIENEILKAEASSTRIRINENDIRIIKMENALAESRKEAVRH